MEKQIKVYYTTWLPEDIEIGATDTSGLHDTIAIDTIDEAVSCLMSEFAKYPSSSCFHENVWYTCRDMDEDYVTGARTEYTFHLKGFTKEEQEIIYNAMKGK